MKMSDDENKEFYLPEEIIILYILSRLPVKSLLRFKSVSKRFRSIISNPDFARLHLKKSTSSNNNSHLLINHKSGFLSFDFESFGGGPIWDCSPFNDQGDILNDKSGLARIITRNFPHYSDIFVIGSSDGLVCLTTKFGLLCIWNPTTLECRTFCYMYSKGYICRKNHVDVVWGFGCVTSGRNYKIVRICQDRSNNEKIIQVLSSLNSKWTFSKEEMDGFGTRRRLTGLGVSVNHVMYWLYRAYDVDNRELRWWIIGFDLIFEKLKQVSSPNWHQIGGFQRPPLMYVMEEHLCACWKINDSQVIEVGMLKEGTWMKLHQLNDNMVVHSMCYWQEMPNITNKNRFAIKDGRNRDTLLLIDHAQESPEDVHTLRIPSSTNIVNYTESLISPFVPGINKPGINQEFLEGVPNSTIYRSRWLKLNADGSWQLKDFDALNGPSSGRWNWDYKCRYHVSEKDAITNELLAITEGLKIAYKKGWTCIEISTETNAIASLFNNPDSRPHHSHINLIRECRDWMTKINAVKLDFLSREPNGVDDLVAKQPRLSNMIYPDYLLIWIDGYR